MGLIAEMIKGLRPNWTQSAVARPVRIKTNAFTHHHLVSPTHFYANEWNASTATVGSITFQPWIARNELAREGGQRGEPKAKPKPVGGVFLSGKPHGS